MARYYYHVTVRHDGLGKHRVIRGVDSELVEAAAAAQQFAWNEHYARKIEIAERRRERDERKKELEDNLSEAEERTSEAQTALNELRGIMAATLRLDDRVDWERLKQHEPFPPRPLPRPYYPMPTEPQPDESRYRPHLGLIDKFFRSSAEKKQATARAIFEADCAKWREQVANVEATNQSIYEASLREAEDWRRRAIAYEEARTKQNAAVDRRRVDYQALSSDAILDYCDVVLSQSKYPECVPQNFELDYRPTAKTLVVDYQLPAPEDLPRLEDVKYVKSKDEFVESEMSKRQFEQFYEEVVCQVVIRTLHELFEADVVRALDAVVLNSTVRARNPGTGHVETRCILSVRANRADFLGINLRQVEPRACLDSLGGVAGAKLAELRAITPLDAVDRSEDRFAGATDLGGEGAAGLGEWQELVRTLNTPQDIRFLPVGSLARVLGFPAAEKFSMELSRDFSSAVFGRGFAIEPDAGRCAAAYRATDEIALFRPFSLAVTGAYPGAAALLQLCVMIATADEQPTEAELKVARDFILRNVTLTPSEQQRLAALEQVLCRKPELARRSLARLAKRLPVEQRQAIGEVLVCVAGADGRITSSEWAALDRACKALDLPADALEEILRRLGATFEEPTMQEAEPGERGEAIPAAETRPGMTAPAFALDMARVAAISHETAEVVGLLAKVMSEDDRPAIMKPTRAVAAPAAAPISPASPPHPLAAQFPSWLGSLTPKYQSIAARIVARPSWSRGEFQQLAAEFMLMPLGVCDALNEWADEHLGDFLVEGDDPVTVNQSILPKQP